MAAPRSIGLCVAAICLALPGGCRRAATPRAPAVESGPPATLEFRIVANSQDDKEAQEAALKLFRWAQTDGQLREELEGPARDGHPPPPPRSAAGDAFDTALGRFTYAWAELAPSERVTLGLDAPAGGDAAPGGGGVLPEDTLRQVAEAREQCRPCAVPFMAGALLYSRACRDARLPAEERERRAFDYFLLLRDPRGEGDAVTGEHLASAYVTLDRRGRPAIGLYLDAAGGERLHRLTTANAPDPGGLHRYMAILVDGRVVAAPAIYATVGRELIVEGNFTRQGVDRMVATLRRGVGAPEK